jgi:hypothetical protein
MQNLIAAATHVRMLHAKQGSGTSEGRGVSRFILHILRIVRVNLAYITGSPVFLAAVYKNRLLPR